MNLVLNLPADLEARIKKLAEEAGLDLPAYVLQTLRVSDLELTGEPSISNEQFEASLNRLREIHARVPADFEDSRESIYERRGEWTVGLELSDQHISWTQEKTFDCPSRKK